jgi:hypothetical protein
MAAVTAMGTVAGMAGLALVSAPAAAATPRPAAPRSASASPSAAPGSYVALTPQRLLDTRTGTPMAPRSDFTLAVAGHDNVPSSGVGTVVLTATAVADPSGGYLTIYADGGARPTVASLNYVGGYARSNQVFTELGPDGAVTIYNGADTATNLTIDVSGYYVAGGSAAGSYVPVTPVRLLDTRTGPKAAAGTDRWVTVAGAGTVPSRVSAVVLNVAALRPTSSGHVDVNDQNFAGGQSSVYFRTGQSVSNLVVVTLEGAGRVLLTNRTYGHTHFTADVFGYFTTGAPAATGMFGPDADTGPVIDTRRIDGTLSDVPIPARGTLDVTIGGARGVPASASAVALNVTATGGNAPGYLTSYPTGSARPATATLDFTADYNMTDLAVLPLGAGGKITFFNGSLRPVDLVVSAVGFVGAVPGPLRWSSPHVADPQAALLLVSCPLASFCLGVDLNQQYVTFDGTAWTSPAPTGQTVSPSFLSCASASFCIALAFSGTSAIYRGGAWSAGPTFPTDPGNDQITDLSCASTSFCVAVGGDQENTGYAWIYDGTAWSAGSTISTAEALSSVSCVSAQFCMAVGQGRDAVRYDGHSWTSATIAVGEAYYDSFVSCASAAFCLATSKQASQSFDGHTWSLPQSFAAGSPLYSVRVACAGASLCAGLSLYGAIGFNTGAGWSDLANLAQPGPFTGIQCPTASFCMVIDRGGYVSIGTPL